MQQHTRSHNAGSFENAGFGVETHRCPQCDQVWPRSAMRWGELPTGPVWRPRNVRVLRCPECLPA